MKAKYQGSSIERGGNERDIGKLAFFLLNLGVYPLYIAPRSPWNNGQVEGFNSVFSKKFWNKLQFSDEQEINVRIKDFNVAYEKYSRLVYGFIDILKHEIKLPKDEGNWAGCEIEIRVRGQCSG